MAREGWRDNHYILDFVVTIGRLAAIGERNRNRAGRLILVVGRAPTNVVILLDRATTQQAANEDDHNTQIQRYHNTQT